MLYAVPLCRSIESMIFLIIMLLKNLWWCPRSKWIDVEIGCYVTLRFIPLGAHFTRCIATQTLKIEYLCVKFNIYHVICIKKVHRAHHLSRNLIYFQSQRIFRFHHVLSDVCCYCCCPLFYCIITYILFKKILFLFVCSLFSHHHRPCSMPPTQHNKSLNNK